MKFIRIVYYLIIYVNPRLGIPQKRYHFSLSAIVSNFNIIYYNTIGISVFVYKKNNTHTFIWV